MEALRQYGTRDFDWFWYGLAILVPFVSVFIAIWWLAHERVGPGLAVLLTGWVALTVWAVVLTLAGTVNVLS